MELRCCSAFRQLSFIGLLSVAWLISCGSGENATNRTSTGQNNRKVPNMVKPERTQSSAADTATKKDITLKYQNQSTSIEIPIDPSRQNVVMELDGVKKPAPEDSVIEARIAKRVTNVMKYFRRAQNQFYNENYDLALEMINQSLEVQETAYALGLKGSIYFMMDELEKARTYWNQAVELDPQIPLPDIPQLEEMIENIKSSETE